MTMRRRIAIGCASAFLIVVVAVVALVLLDPLCDNRLLADVAAPDGARHAVVFRRDCGSFLDTHSTHVSVLPKWRSGRRYGGNVFVADSAFGRAPGIPASGQPRVAVRWLDRRTLEVCYDAWARVLNTPPLLDEDVVVRFVADSG